MPWIWAPTCSWPASYSSRVKSDRSGCLSRDHGIPLANSRASKWLHSYPLQAGTYSSPDLPGMLFPNIWHLKAQFLSHTWSMQPPIFHLTLGLVCQHVTIFSKLWDSPNTYAIFSLLLRSFLEFSITDQTTSHLFFSLKTFLEKYSFLLKKMIKIPPCYSMCFFIILVTTEQLNDLVQLPCAGIHARCKIPPISSYDSCFFPLWAFNRFPFNVQH